MPIDGQASLRSPPPPAAVRDRLQLNPVIDYSSREAIRRGELLPPADLLIRTGGEQRLSDFLLWEYAYAELYFTARRWQDFGPRDLAEALAAHHRRERRFGRVPDAPSASLETTRSPATSSAWAWKAAASSPRARAASSRIRGTMVSTRSSRSWSTRSGTSGGGVQLKPAFAEGGGGLSEGLAWYSAMRLAST